MKLKRTAAAVLAALTAVSAASVCAFAEENKAELATLNWADIHGMKWMSSLGDGYFLYFSESRYAVDGVVHIEKNDKGELTYTDVETDIDFSKNIAFGNGRSEYFQLIEKDAEGNAVKRYVLHLDKSSNKATTINTFPGDYIYTHEEGYTVAAKKSNDSKTLTIEVTTPTGETKSSSLTYNGSGEWWWYSTFLSSGDNLGYVIWMTDSGLLEDTDWNVCGYDIYKIDKNGKLNKIHHADNAYNFGYAGAGENYYCANEQQVAKFSMHYVLRDDGSIVKIYDGDGQLKGAEGALAVRYINDVNNDMAIAQCYYPSISDSEEYEYALLDLDQLSKSILDIEVKTYKSMNTADNGKTYLVKNADGKWGFLDEKGNEIGEWFDDAGEFIGDYAPVIKDGKGYLIDRNFNRVSDIIDATGVTTYDDDLFRFENGDEIKFVTYNTSTSAPADETSKPEETSKPADTSKPAETSKPADSEADKDNPDTGAAGIALTLGLATLAGAAVVVYRKRK